VFILDFMAVLTAVSPIPVQYFLMVLSESL